MSCINPNSEIFAEFRENLGLKFQKAQNVTLRVYGGALEEAVLSCSKIIPNIQVLRDETPKKRGSYSFSGNPRRVVWFCRRGGMTGKSL
jgi:hypothetical protein